MSIFKKIEHLLIPCSKTFDDLVDKHEIVVCIMERTASKAIDAIRKKEDDHNAKYCRS